MRLLDLAVDVRMLEMTADTLWLQAQMFAAQRARIHGQLQRMHAAQHTSAQPSTASPADAANSCGQPAPCPTDAAMDPAAAAAAVALVPAGQSSASALAAALMLGGDIEGALQQWVKQHHNKHWDSLKLKLASLQCITIAFLAQCCDESQTAYNSGSADVKLEAAAFSAVLAPCVLAVFACCQEPHQTPELIVVGGAAHGLI